LVNKYNSLSPLPVYQQRGRFLRDRDLRILVWHPWRRPGLVLEQMRRRRLLIDFAEERRRVEMQRIIDAQRAALSDATTRPVAEPEAVADGQRTAQAIADVFQALLKAHDKEPTLPL